MTKPPLALKVWPTIHDAASEARNRTAAATSSGLADPLARAGYDRRFAFKSDIGFSLA